MSNLLEIIKVEFNLRYISGVKTVDTINLTDEGVAGIHENHIGVIVEYDSAEPIKILNAVKITFKD